MDKAALRLAATTELFRLGRELAPHMATPATLRESLTGAKPG
jgi:hypothetical protein